MSIIFVAESVEEFSCQSALQQERNPCSASVKAAVSPAKSSDGKGTLPGAKLHLLAFLSHDTEAKSCGMRQASRHDGL